MKDNDLPLPSIRCLSKEEAASYLGIGVTLLSELDIPTVKFGRRLVYDKVDLDLWLEEYKQRGRAGKEFIWPVKPESTSETIHHVGGLTQHSQTAKEYAKVLGLKTEPKLKRF
ncbi:MAG TPA: helix-turn-helix domain-containing protein [Methylotenera sp.]|nr:helix-turn-helix domain-containing protein [Methylotenera sp.]HPV44872.1 helix-turn-helix domain-containing protein [Methylotenera sp.]